MMRCLRCAVDYPADKRYCDRCGRALMRPPGARGEEDAGGILTISDTSHFYTTSSPPGAEATPRGSAAPSSAVQAPQAPADTSIAGWGSSALTGPPASGKPEARGDLPLPWDSGESGAGPRNGQAEVLAAFSLPALTANLDTSSWRMAGTRRQAQRRRHQILLAAAGVFVVLLGGLLLWRHSVYTTDLDRARRLLAAHRYGGAIAAFNVAIGEWPFNDEAQNGLLAAQATATAVTQNLQQNTSTQDLQQGMYQAQLRLRQQVAQQADSDSWATATAVAQAQATVQAQATSTAVARATAGEARAEARATATAIAQATATALSARATATAQAVAAQVTATAVAVAPQAIRIPSFSSQPVVYAAAGGADALGVGATNPQAESPPALLAAKLASGSQLLSFGKSDALLSGLVQVQAPGIISSHPDLVTIWVGANDIDARTPPESFRAQLDALLTALRHGTHAVIVIGNVPDLTYVPHYLVAEGRTLADTVAAYNAAIAREAAAHQAILVDLYGATHGSLPSHPEYLSTDSQHFSTIGYAALARVWWATISTRAR